MLLSQQKREQIIAWNEDKENNNTHQSPVVLSKANPLAAFRDVSNITPTSTPTSSNVKSQRRRKRVVIELEDEEELSNDATLSHAPAQYASTLPSFDEEYSPFGMLSQPFLDRYFNQPRYITMQPPKTDVDPQPHSAKKTKLAEPAMRSAVVTKTPVFQRMQSTPARISLSQTKARSFLSLQQNHGEEETLTSADVGDVTLDRMIEAILESARKDPVRKTARRRFSCNFKLEKPDLRPHFARSIKEELSFDSHTYTAGDDPTSDLPDDFFRCSSSSETTIESSVSVATVDQQVPKPAVMFNEREVKTPDSTGKHLIAEKSDVNERCIDSHTLRRQNALRRKTAKTFKPIH